MSMSSAGTNSNGTGAGAGASAADEIDIDEFTHGPSANKDGNGNGNGNDNRNINDMSMSMSISIPETGFNNSEDTDTDVDTDKTTTITSPEAALDPRTDASASTAAPTATATSTATSASTATATATATSAEKHPKKGRSTTMDSSFATFNALDPRTYASTGYPFENSNSNSNQNNSIALYHSETFQEEDEDEYKEKEKGQEGEDVSVSSAVVGKENIIITNNDDNDNNNNNDEEEHGSGNDKSTTTTMDSSVATSSALDPHTHTSTGHPFEYSNHNHNNSIPLYHNETFPEEAEDEYKEKGQEGEDGSVSSAGIGHSVCDAYYEVEKILLTNNSDHHHNNNDEEEHGNEEEENDDDSSHGGGTVGQDSPYGRSTTNSNSNSNSNSNESPLADSDSMAIGRKENEAFQRWRIFLFLFLIFITVGVALTTHSLVRKQEHEAFEQAFADDTLKVVDSLSHSSDAFLNAVDSLAFWMVSSARNNQQTWPLTVLPGFAVKAAKTRSLANAIAIQQYQIVSEEDRRAWERYCKSEEGWVSEVIALEQKDPAFRARDYEEIDDHLRDYTFVSDFSSGSWPSRPIWYGEGYSGVISIPAYQTAEGTTGTGARHPHPYQYEYYAPSWQSYPLLADGGIYSPYNFNAMEHKKLGPAIRRAVEEQRVVIGSVINFDDSNDRDGNNIFQSWITRFSDDAIDPDEPIISVLYPIIDTAKGAITRRQRKSKVVGLIAATFLWRSYLEDILPSSESTKRGLTVVFENSCNQTFTFSVEGGDVTFMGGGDLHKPIYYHDPKHTEEMMETVDFEALLTIVNDEDTGGRKENYAGIPIDQNYCTNTIKIYPSPEIMERYHTNAPGNYAVIFASIFIITALFFVTYDCFVARRQKKVMQTAIQSSTIVSSLFPSSVRDRLLEDDNGVMVSPRSLLKNTYRNTNKGDDPNTNTAKKPTEDNNNEQQQQQQQQQPNKLMLRSILYGGGGQHQPAEAEAMAMEMAKKHNKPIADLFPDTTVIIADIAGFTAWSSVREPTQVFTLLEVVYGAFDTIATKRKVFKVETIGDSYVAVTGLPDPRPSHAVVMAKFAFDCRTQFNELCSVLEGTLGPETGDLKLRIGLHSGPVTAGVLRGQKSRFQLFGDTVNTASRMESTGRANKIQVTQETAKLLQEGKKGHWLEPRDDDINVKGKGMMTTFWVEPKRTTASISSSRSRTNSQYSSTHMNEVMPSSPSSTSFSLKSPALDDQTERLIKWNVVVLETLLKKIALRRIALGQKEQSDPSIDWNKPKEGVVLHEVKDVIKLPAYNSRYIDHAENPDSVILAKGVKSQLREFVAAIACTYNAENPFHNFPHASHVGMSVSKLLSRIVAPDRAFEKNEQLHDHTYGITSDPLTQFACVFSALIHDADHPGVPNSQLSREEAHISKIYEGKSTAEQNSINLSWEILARPDYEQLRNAIAHTRKEAERFRQLVVNAVCATDIIDKDLKACRNQRWEKAFAKNNANTKGKVSTTPLSSSMSISSASSSTSSSFFRRDRERPSPDSDDLGGSERCLDARERVNRKATIVIEHIMQASDIAHTMQHWHIYIKWNERLYAEMYKAYVEGRAETDPTVGWYEGEIGFFDFYIIPLAEKLSECGVFGVSSDEYLDYAIMNRQEWEKKGREIVASYVEKYQVVASSSKDGDKDDQDHRHGEDYVGTHKELEPPPQPQYDSAADHHLSSSVPLLPSLNPLRLAAHKVKTKNSKSKRRASAS